MLVQYFVSQMAPNPGGKKFVITPENTDRMLSVLQNSLVIGVSGATDMAALAQTSGNNPGQFLKQTGLFFILDTTGKEDQFNQLWPALVAALPKEIAHTHYDFSGTSIEKFVGPNNTTFSARAGNRFVWSNQQKAIEDLIGRLKSAAPSANSLAENADLQHCQAHPVPGAVLDFFYRFPDLSALAVPSNPQVDTTSMIKAMHLNAMHAACGNMSITPEGEFARIVVLSDISQDSPLSWLGSNRAQFDSLALVPPRSERGPHGRNGLRATRDVSHRRARCVSRRIRLHKTHVAIRRHATVVCADDFKSAAHYGFDSQARTDANFG
jgi:hypothetical protein